MCKDEYVMLMTWKKTAAGDIIYNKCPPNATGEGRGVSIPPSPGGSAIEPPALVSPAGSASRRCLLNPHGVAYWGVPSFARCISHEYRYLHLSVGARSVPCPCGPSALVPCYPHAGWGSS